ncbi:MAG: DUF2891 domain-containing protein [Prevotellaceae bacterium]|jgi:hypothetical protein|nr:DUF2891 domain-containing protein [Prevotellaceae bacterium]
MKRFVISILFSLAAFPLLAQHYTKKADGSLTLSEEGVSRFALLALACISQEFPNKTGHIQMDANDTKQPSEYHSAFYGCFDWHSSVHGHWMLVKLLKEFPDMPDAGAIRKAIDKNLTAQNIRIEVEYFYQGLNKSYERTYGWAWLLKLQEELYKSTDVQMRQWYQNLQPLAELIEQKYIEFLPRQTYAIRSGVHPNTAFGISLALDYAITTEKKQLENLLKERSLAYYKSDKNCPGDWEPGGADFISPCLMEAELMGKVLDKAAYQRWLLEFFPNLKNGKPTTLLEPATVTDRNDLQLVHLDGLNLSRAWCMLAISRLIDDTGLKNRLIRSAAKHIEVTLPTIANGSYAGEHWLASFAIYALFI